MPTMTKTTLRTIRESFIPKQTQESVARDAGITLTTYRNIEAGGNCSYTSAQGILRSLNKFKEDRGEDPTLTLDDLGLSIV